MCVKPGEDQNDQVAVGASEIYLAHVSGTVLWTFVTVAGIVIVIGWLAWRPQRGAWTLVSGPDCHLSLWRAQVAAWTIAIGSMVTAFGLIHLAIPKIPNSLVVLMGMSLVTGGIRYSTTKDDEQKLAASGPLGKPNPRDLIIDHTDQSVSLAKAQMLFWTILMLVLFVSKSAQDGTLWNVPWELVALMGFSQAGYVGPKAVENKDKKNGQEGT